MPRTSLVIGPWLGPLVLGLACGGAPAEAPVARPDEAALVGTWGLTVEAHRDTGKRYGRPANAFELELRPDHTARWADVPAAVWSSGAPVLERVEGAGTWALVERDGAFAVLLTDGAGERLARVQGSESPPSLVLPEVDRPDRGLELVPAPPEAQ